MLGVHRHIASLPGSARRCQERLESLSRMPANSAKEGAKADGSHMPSNAARAIAGKTSLRLPLLGSTVPVASSLSNLSSNLLPGPALPSIARSRSASLYHRPPPRVESTINRLGAFVVWSTKFRPVERSPAGNCSLPAFLPAAGSPPLSPPFFPGPEQLKAARFSSSPSLSTLKPLLHWPSEAARSSCP